MSGTAHFLALDDHGNRIDHVTPDLLRPFLMDRADGRSGAVEIRAEDARFEDGELEDGELEDGEFGDSLTPTGSVRATPEHDGGWAVAIETTGRTLLGRAPNTDAVYDLLRSWAAGDGWWQDAFSWRPAP